MVFKKPRIVIIGAGMAGLTAANKLHTIAGSKEVFELQGLDAYRVSAKEEEELKGSESEYQMFPGEEITIAKGYMSIIESLASVLPHGLVQFGRKVTRIEWQPKRHVHDSMNIENGSCSRPVKLHFCDGSIMYADHVIVTVSLGVLKAAIHDDDSGMFCPPLPPFKVEAISRLGFGVVNKLFMQLSPTHERKDEDPKGFPFLQMVFHSPHSELRDKKIPLWMRRTATLCPIYKNSSVLLSWFAGEEALALESLKDEEIIEGVSATVSSFLSNSHLQRVLIHISLQRE
ncbi:hypothetical protein SESBI_05933 [Sesbania bispinosa]|nr:hypothetical protein SESBI_05933 [Sesbania bispinosa]